MDEIIDIIFSSENVLFKLIASLIILGVNPAIRFLVKKLVVQSGILSSKSEVRIKHVIRIICYAINLLTILIITLIWGVEPRNVVVVFSSLFTIIGVAMFAQWSILSNITAGIVIFFSMPFRVGDEIEIYDKDSPIKGVIENIMTFTIHLRREDGGVIVMSNTIFLQKVLIVKDRRTE